MAPERNIICFSHLRWDFVFQRPQQILSRAAQQFKVHFVEEPRFGHVEPHLDIRAVGKNIAVIVPAIPEEAGISERDSIQRDLTDQYIRLTCEVAPIGWYYTPMALRFTRHLRFALTVYDCMDELSGFKGAPPELPLLERELLRKANLVFAGGQSLFENKSRLHDSVYAFPSSVDRAHFMRARTFAAEPPALQNVPHPRIGYFGVIDERLDLSLIRDLASSRPQWQLVMIGPTAKIDPATLPQASNIHWIGAQNYTDLPRWLSTLDIGMMPFALNEATRYISPTKTPEFLAAGLPVVSTPVPDVVRTWGRWGLVSIARDAPAMVSAIEKALNLRRSDQWLQAVDARLSTMSWDKTWSHMLELIEDAAAKAIAQKQAAPPPSLKSGGVKHV